MSGVFITKEIWEKDHWFDPETENAWRKDVYTYEQALAARKTLVKCEKCRNCSHCTNCVRCDSCHHCVGCFNCYDDKFCINTSSSYHGTGLIDCHWCRGGANYLINCRYVNDSRECENCANSAYLYRCKYMVDSIGCINSIRCVRIKNFVNAKDKHIEMIGSSYDLPYLKNESIDEPILKELRYGGPYEYNFGRLKRKTGIMFYVKGKWKRDLDLEHSWKFFKKPRPIFKLRDSELENFSIFNLTSHLFHSLSTLNKIKLLEYTIFHNKPGLQKKLLKLIRNPKSDLR